MSKDQGNFGPPFQLQVGGRSYPLAYPDQVVKDDFVEWLKASAWKEMQVAKKYLDAESCGILLSNLHAEMVTEKAYNWGGKRCLQNLLKGDGIARFVWMLLVRHDPKVTEDDAADIVKTSLKEDEGEVNKKTGEVIRNPYLVQTILNLIDQGKSKPAKAGTPANS